MLRYVLPLVFFVRPSIVYDLIRRRLTDIIPLNTLLGIEIVSIGDGIAETRLAFRTEITNHIGSMHATAIFGLAEAASGCAMSGAFAPVVLGIRPLAASANLSFSKIARTDLVATAKTSEAPDALRAKLDSVGKVLFDVLVNIRDTAGADIAQMTVAWHVTKK